MENPFNEKRYVEVDVNWDDENKVWYEYDGDGSYNIYSSTHTLPELILKEHPKLGEDIGRYKKELDHPVKDHIMINDCRRRIADSILSILGIKKDG